MSDCNKGSGFVVCSGSQGYQGISGIWEQCMKPHVCVCVYVYVYVEKVSVSVGSISCVCKTLNRAKLTIACKIRSDCLN